MQPAEPHGLDRVREGLRTHIEHRLRPNPAGIAVALATGDQNAVDQDDADAMRRAGLTHLLSVSGLHIAAVVAFAMFLSLRLLALSETLALRLNLVLVSAGVAAAAGIGYTLLTGAQVPTVRSCVAALLILGGIALGRDALSMRLIATGALVVLLFRPEALAGAQLPDELRIRDRDCRDSLDPLGQGGSWGVATRGSWHGRRDRCSESSRQVWPSKSRSRPWRCFIFTGPDFTACSPISSPFR